MSGTVGSVNCLELLAVRLTLQHFLPFLRGCHMLVRMDNTTTVAYINRQGGLRSRCLCMLACRLILWSDAHLLSLNVMHFPKAQNREADLLSRGNRFYGEWRLHPPVVKQLWERFGRAEVDLFVSKENAQCPLFFSLHVWPHIPLYGFPPLALISPTLYRVRESRLRLLLIAALWPSVSWLAEITHLLCGQPWPLPLRRDRLLSQAVHPHPEQPWPVSGFL
uniref:uncharacterized protein n=1 Tax=Centroberyx gerrardi TaxID=166262 RepID=UPI003AAB73CD